MNQNKKYVLKIGRKTYNIFLGNKKYIIPIKATGNSIIMGTKNVIYLSEEGDYVKVFIKMLDKDHHTLECILMEPNMYHSLPCYNHVFARRKQFTRNYDYSESYDPKITKRYGPNHLSIIYKFNIDLNNNTYLIKKDQLRRTLGIKNCINRFNRRDTNVLRIVHKISPGLYKSNHLFINFASIHGRKLKFIEEITK